MSDDVKIGDRVLWFRRGMRNRNYTDKIYGKVKSEKQTKLELEIFDGAVVRLVQKEDCQKVVSKRSTIW